MGKTLEIDLGSGEWNAVDSDMGILKSFLGGRGLGARFLFDFVGPSVSPFDPENVVVVAPGPLAGTSVPASGRFSLTTKSPLTGTIFDSNSGGTWGVAFKLCGYDALIVRGRARRPSYIYIDSEDVRISPAGRIWGMDAKDAVEALKGIFGDGINVLSIGPAGENGVLYASIVNDGRRSLGRGGMGAVLGAKNLKAIATRGMGRVSVADPSGLRSAVGDLLDLIGEDTATSISLPEYGTASLINVYNEIGALPTRNFQCAQFSGAERISGEAMTERLLVGRSGCHGCTIRCSRVVETGSFRGEGPEHESTWALGANLGIDDLELIAEANHLCNRLGMDTISAGGTIAAAMEMTERGVRDFGIRFGEDEKLLGYLTMIARREGVGGELAEGAERLAIRSGAPDLAMHVKGLELPAFDPRGSQGMGLAYATSNRGACHLRGGYITRAEVLEGRLDRFAYLDKAPLVIELQNWGAVMDSLVACHLASVAIPEDLWAEILRAATGVDFSIPGLRSIGERIYNLERLYNIREGFSRRDDTLPRRLLNEPLHDGPSAGHVVHLEEMLEEYYELRGWDSSGTPKAETLRKLGLDRLASPIRIPSQIP